MGKPHPTCSISGVDLAFVSFGVPVSPFAFLGLRLLRKISMKIARKINETFHKYHKTPQSKKNNEFLVAMTHFLIWKKKHVVNEKHDQRTQLIYHLPNLDRKKIHSWSSTGLLPDCCWSLSGLTGGQGKVRCEFPAAKSGSHPPFSAGRRWFLFGVGMQKKRPTFFFEHQHITALRELLTSCSGSTQSYFLFLACCNNWCNWCQTSSGCVSNQSRIFSNTRGHSPFSCSICIWAHANDPVNWRVDSGSDSALSRFCCKLSLASNC